MENSASTIADVTTAITGLASTVADNALGMIAAILPVLAPVIAAVILVMLGKTLVKRFAK